MKRISLLVAAAAFVAASRNAASAADNASSAFLVKAIEGNFAEVQMGKLAQKTVKAPA